jgi:hypothetical protein
MNFKLLTAATVLTVALASPAFAMGPHARSEAVAHQQQRAQSYRDGGFWPGEVAGSVVGGAIGAAGAIATAPFRNDNYAYNDGYTYDGGYNAYYGAGPYNYNNSGFVCRPGTTFIGEDGLRHLCQ